MISRNDQTFSQYSRHDFSYGTCRVIAGTQMIYSLGWEKAFCFFNGSSSGVPDTYQLKSWDESSHEQNSTGNDSYLSSPQSNDGHHWAYTALKSRLLIVEFLFPNMSGETCIEIGQFPTDCRSCHCKSVAYLIWNYVYINRY